MRMAALSLTLCLALAGCGPCAVETAVRGGIAKRDAQKVADAYFTCARERKYDACMTLYSPEFWKAIPKETWRKILPNVEAELGPLESCKLEHWQAGTFTGTSGSHAYADLTYACKHTNFEATVAFRISDESGKHKIVTQNYNSIGFLVE